MTPERWQLVAQTFEAALELPADQRIVYLAETGSTDPSLRSEVEALLAEDARLDPTDAAPSADLGQHIGAYRIVRLIGEGGMGKVYEAERADDAFDRHVAIKLLQPTVFSRHLTQRFLLERQILARLNHPNIATLLDAGTTPDGRHYFVMEYVEEGVPIHVYCRDRNLDLTARIRLFQTVCDAVQYAHRNLVLHRDLKPQNILVTPAGQVKLLDFGIAKLMQPEIVGGAADLTATDLAPMTPTYASPEQVRGEPITTASDVYSLGVILYELLAGRKPYGANTHTRGELERVICETDPPLPSQIARQLVGDLDAIVMMALRKEPALRYQSPSELRDDLANHLDGRPVRARRGTFSYRAGKLIRRYRLAFAAAAAVIVALAAGLIATLTQARIARNERALADRRFNEIRKIANGFLFEFDNAISDLAGATAARQLVVRKAVEYLSALDRESHGDARLQSELAAAWQRVGDIQGAPYGANLGDRAGALRSYREALRIWTLLAAQPAKTADVQTHLALLHRGMGDVLSEDQRHQDALTEYRSSLAILESLSPRPSQQKLILTGRIGTELVMLGRVQEGTEWSRRAVEQANSLLSAGMDESARHDVSELYARAGRALLRAGAIDAALAMHREEIALCENLVSSVASEKNAHYRRDLALAYRNLGDALLRQNELPAALARYEQAKPIQETLLRVDDANAQMRMELSVTWSKISELLAQTGDIAGAERARANDLRLSERLMKDDPQSPAYRRGYSYSLFQMANLLRKAARPTEAKRYFLRQAETLRPLENRPDKPTQRQLLNCYRALGELESDPKGSAAYLNKALLLAGNLGDDSAAQSIRDVLAHLSN